MANINISLEVVTMDFLHSFHEPPRTHSPLAFWFWNGELEPERLREQLDEMVDKGVYGAFMHSRGYLKTPYLEQPWWDAVSATIDQAKKRGFNPWMYDEYAWPSGTVGSTFEYGFQKPSKVLAQGEVNMAKGLTVRIVKSDGEEVSPGGDGQLIARFAVTGPEDNIQINRLSGQEAAPAGSMLMEFRREIYPNHVDYMNADTIRLFLQLTHEEYKKRYGEDFGALIPGIFFDEIFMAGTPLPWTDTLPQEFSRRTGRDLLELLPYLMVDSGEEGRKARLAYYGVVAQLYEEAFFSQISQWCEDNNIALTGHTEENLIDHPYRQGNFFDTMRHLQIPGADNHDYRYRFPRKITYVEPKYAVSVARAYNRERAMSEAMGGAGWGCSLQEFKRGINTMAAMGISMFVLHGFYYECEHQGSQADWPTSFFYQNPYWKYFKHFADYMSRVCLVNATGQAVVEVGLYYPIEDIQANSIAGTSTKLGKAFSDGYHKALASLLENQIDVDLIDRRSVLAARVGEGTLQAGQQNFRILVMPDGMIPDAELEEQLERFTRSGGRVIRYQTGGNDANAVPADNLPQAVASVLPLDIQVVEGSRFDLYACHRIIDNEDWFFLSNSSPRPRTLTIRLRTPFAGSVKKLSLENGDAVAVAAQPVEGGMQIRLTLQADEACYLLPCREESHVVQARDVQEIAVMGRWDFLPLDAAADGEYRIDAKETTLAIPIADFSSELHPQDPRQIRIRNTDWQDGNCARHLSLWDGRWIGRRPSWHCGPMETDLYFRRKIQLAVVPEKARLCIAAVNMFTLWVNGQEVASADSFAKPVEVDIAAYLQAGDNLIAVHVHNDRPLIHGDFNSVEELPTDRTITLLLQGDIQLPGGKEAVKLFSDETWIVSNRLESGWNLIQNDLEANALRADAAEARAFFDPTRPHGAWLYAWERGTPPLLPWGDIPLFGKMLTYPTQVTYGITIPAGASSIAKPGVKGSCTFRLDGREVAWEGEQMLIKPQTFPRRLDVVCNAQGPDDGLQKPVEVTLKPFLTALGDWRLHGLDWFSGRCLYRNDVTMEKDAGRYILDLGQTSFHAEIWINGKLADVRVWQPYRADITDYLQEGRNEIVVVVANSAAVERRNMLVDEGQALGWARYWNRDNIDREGENLTSGLLGPVRIFRQEMR